MHSVTELEISIYKGGDSVNILFFANQGTWTQKGKKRINREIKLFPETVYCIEC